MNETLKRLLDERGITQTRLAELLGRDRSVITHLLKGKRRLKADEAKTIAEFLNVPVGELFGEEVNGMHDSAPTIRFEGTPSADALKSGSIKRTDNGYILRELASCEHEYAIEMPDDSLNLAGILCGDLLVADLKTPPKEGQLCVLQYYQQDNATTLVRRFQPPFLMAHSTQEYAPLAITDEAVRVVCAVKRLIRTIS